MRKILTIAAALVALAACSPQIYPLYLEVRQPSASGLELNRKSFSIAYAQGPDTLYDRTVASSLARALEEDYFGGEEVVEIYSVPATDSVSLQTMHDLVMDTNTDVVFLLSSHLGEPVISANQAVSGLVSADSAFVCPVSIPVNTSLQVYDSMGKDQVLRYKGNAVLRPNVYNNGTPGAEAMAILARHSLDDKADEMGGRIARRFLSEWRTESFSFYYYENETWYKPLIDLADGKFAAAIDGWAPLARRGNNLSRACASYDIAMALYLMEDYEMAEKWLALADKLETLSLSDGLHKRLDIHLQKSQK